MRTWQAHNGTVTGLAYRPDGRLLGSCGYDQWVRVWDSVTGEKVLDLAGEGSPSGTPWTAAVAFSRCGRWIAAAHSMPSLGGPDNVRVWDATTGAVVANHRCGGSSGGLAFTATDPPGLLVTDFPRLLWFKSVLALSPPTIIKHDRGRELPKPARVAVSPDGSRVATNGRYKAVIWDAATMAALAVLKHPKTPNNGPVAFHPAGDRVALGRATKVDLWRFGDRKAEPVELAGHKRPVWGVGFTPDGRTVLTGASDGTVRLWDAETGAPRRAFDFGIGKVYAAAFAPDGLTAVAGGESGQVVVWDLDD